MSTVRVRPARPDEAPILAEMANDLNDHVGIHGRPFTAARVRADGFGLQAAFEWGVHSANAGALEFYRRLGAAGGEPRIMGVAGERLRALAAAACAGPIAS